MERIDRRRFLQIVAGTAAALGGGLASCGNNSGQSPPAKHPQPTSPRSGGQKSLVALCRRVGNFPLNRPIDQKKVDRLLSDTLDGLFDLRDNREGLRELFNPNDIIGIKVNCLSGRKMSTHYQLALSLAQALSGIGVRRENIIIWDRADADLKYAGYKLKRSRGDFQVYGADTAGYSRELVIHRSIGSFTTRIIDRVTAMINLPVLKDHGIVGVTLSLKNFFGAIHNPNKYHINEGDPYVADLYSLPSICGKVKLTIIDGIVGQYEGGPPSHPQWQWLFGGLIAGFDPVALDRTGLDIIERERAAHNRASLSEAGRFPHYLKTAEKLGLGNFRKENIEVREI